MIESSERKKRYNLRPILVQSAKSIQLKKSYRENVSFE